MNHRQRMLDLQLCQGTGHRLGNVLGVRGFAAKDDAEADDRIDRVGQAPRQGRRHRRHLKRARHSHDFRRDLCLGQFRLGGAQHRVDVTGIVARSDNGDSCSGRGIRLGFGCFFQHGSVNEEGALRG